MKKIILFILALCLCFTVFGGSAFAEVAAAEKPAAEMTAEELYQAGGEAIAAEDYGKAMEYYLLSADQGNAEAWRVIGNLYLDGLGVEQSSDKALEYYQRAGDQGDAKAMFNIAITYFLGDLAPYEIERKFLIEYPSVAWLESLPNCQRVEIVQTYLRSEPDHEVRIRQRGSEGNYIYYLTEKSVTKTHKRMELQRRLSEREYLTLLMQADPGLRQISKTRYCLTHAGQYFEIDLFPCWDDQAMVEIELTSEDQEVHFPKELKVIREVTGDPNYRNAVIASKPRGATH